MEQGNGTKNQDERVQHLLAAIEQSVKLNESPLARRGRLEGLTEVAANLAELKLYVQEQKLSFLAYLIEMALHQAAVELDDVRDEAS